MDSWKVLSISLEFLRLHIEKYTTRQLPQLPTSPSIIFSPPNTLNQIMLPFCTKLHELLISCRIMCSDLSSFISYYFLSFSPSSNLVTSLFLDISSRVLLSGSLHSLFFLHRAFFFLRDFRGSFSPFHSGFCFNITWQEGPPLTTLYNCGSVIL